jgi:uncharacterized LabA/DUF88 family protein
MVAPPANPRAIAFVDGQNLFHAARLAFGYRFPNYDVRPLVERICAGKGWTLAQIRFCTGVPDPADNAFWHHFWTHKLAQMGRTGVHVYSRTLRYHNQSIKLPDGTEHTALVGREKGIDVRLALDLVTLAIDGHYDVGLILSQDQDLSEAVEDVKLIARQKGQWVWLASAFPHSPTSPNKRGIDKTDWIRIDKATYDACIDPRDYRPKPPPPGGT